MNMIGRTTPGVFAGNAPATPKLSSLSRGSGAGGQSSSSATPLATPQPPPATPSKAARRNHLQLDSGLA